VEGRYNDILKPGVHYISVKPDLTDVSEAVRQFKDLSFRRAMVEATYEYVRTEHTYAHRVSQLLTAVRSGIGAGSKGSHRQTRTNNDRGQIAITTEVS
jgi:spore maturation protein CgeB